MITSPLGRMPRQGQPTVSSVRQAQLHLQHIATTPHDALRHSRRVAAQDVNDAAGLCIYDLPPIRPGCVTRYYVDGSLSSSSWSKHADGWNAPNTANPIRPPSPNMHKTTSLICAEHVRDLLSRDGRGAAWRSKSAVAPKGSKSSAHRALHRVQHLHSQLAFR